MISCGGLYAFLFFLYILVAYDNARVAKISQMKLYKYYSEKNLCKMEYDISYYYEEESVQEGGDKQVSIDDLMRENEDNLRKNGDFFKPIEYTGVEEVVGKYDPEKGK